MIFQVWVMRSLICEGGSLLQCCSAGSRPGTARSSNVTITASSKIGGGKRMVTGKAPEVTIQATRRPPTINQQNFPSLGGTPATNSTVRFSIR